jgi:hypothetical protein
MEVMETSNLEAILGVVLVPVQKEIQQKQDVLFAKRRRARGTKKLLFASRIGFSALRQPEQPLKNKKFLLLFAKRSACLTF